MASAKLNIEVGGKSYGLYFGMASTRIFQERSALEYKRLVDSGIKEPTQADFDPYKTFAFVIHSGLCNMADILDEQRPEFIDSYALSEDISRDAGLCETINRVWSESQPVVEMLEKLNSSLEAEKKSQVKPTGKKSKPLPLES